MLLTAILLRVQSPATAVGWGEVVKHAAGWGALAKDWTAAAESFVTALAVLVGGVWAYYRFVKGRTFRPRVSIEVLGQWRHDDGVQVSHSWLPFQHQPPKATLLHVRIRVTNIGAAKAALKEEGTGVEVSFPNNVQPVLPHSVRWENSLAAAQPQTQGPGGMFPVFEGQEWIEPGETISDDLLLDLGHSATNAQLDVYLSWRLARWRRGVDDFTRVIIPSDSTMIDNS